MARPPTRAGTAPFFLALGLALLLWGSYWGLFLAPGERFMGDVQRIMYVHVPTAWNSMLALTVRVRVPRWRFLFTNRWEFDHVLEAALEVGVVLGVLLCMPGLDLGQADLGRLVGLGPAAHHHRRPGVRRLGDPGPARLRGRSGEARGVVLRGAIVAYVDVPIVYFSVRWWNSLHQMQSTPQTVSSAFHWPLRINAFGVLFLWIGLVMLRARLAALRLHGGDERAGAGPMTGVIQGGTEFVIAAYVITALVLGGYTASVVARFRRARRRAPPR